MITVILEKHDFNIAPECDVPVKLRWSDAEERIEVFYVCMDIHDLLTDTAIEAIHDSYESELSPWIGEGDDIDVPSYKDLNSEI